MSQESPGVEARLQLEIHEDLEAFHEAAERLRLFLEERDVEESTRYAVELIAEELATNVVKYGFRDEAHRVLHLAVELRGERALLAFTDDGAAFDPTAPRAIASPGHLSEARAGGLGLHLVRQFADTMSYRRDGHLNCTVVSVARDREHPQS